MPSSFFAASVFQVVLTPPNVLGSITAFAPQNPWDSRGCQLLMLHKDLVICSIQSSLLLIKAFYLLPSLLENHKVFTYSLLQLKGFFFSLTPRTSFVLLPSMDTTYQSFLYLLFLDLEILQVFHTFTPITTQARLPVWKTIKLSCEAGSKNNVSHLLST